MHPKIIINRIKAAKEATNQPQQLQFRPFQVKQWRYFLEEARAFREKHGHCMISQKSNADPELSRWAKRQRYQYKQYKQYVKGVRRPGQKPCQLTPERINALNEIGFCWDTHEVIWEERFNELKEFSRVYGHLNVPSGPRGNDQLATWIKGQRRQYKLRKNGSNHSITADRIERLTNIGFRWELGGASKQVDG